MKKLGARVVYQAWRSSMNGNAMAAGDGQAGVETLAAELASADYPVLLRQGLGGPLIELERGPWRSLSEMGPGVDKAFRSAIGGPARGPWAARSRE
jgi:hypothetical protein